VENAIFKVHRYFLTKYSTVLQDMFNTPQGDGTVDGTDERPLVLSQDTAVGWELLLDAIYDRFASLLSARTIPLLIMTFPSHSLKDLQGPSGKDMLAILPIAHKYCMDGFETAILERLSQAHSTETFVNLMVASQIVDSQSLYQQALQGLISCTPKPNLLQATRIGVEAHHAIMEAALSTANDSTSSAESSISSLTAAINAQKSLISTARAESSKLKAELAQVKVELVHASFMTCRSCDSETDWRCMSETCVQMRSQSRSTLKPARKGQRANVST
jgi:hypothetical protein